MHVGCNVAHYNVVAFTKFQVRVRNFHKYEEQIARHPAVK
jgi:hypothetical protein